jgi:preprotein translocase subunit SecD
MLYISRWKAAAILVTVITVSAMAIPNFLSEGTFRSLPRWAQHRIVPGIEYQGGSRSVFQVDHERVRRDTIERVQDNAKKILREAKVGQIQAPAIRDGSVQMRIRESDLQRALAVLREWFVPDVIIEADGDSVRLIVARETIRAETKRRLQRTFDLLKRRTEDVDIVHTSIEPIGADLFVVVLPGVTRLPDMLH